MNLLRLFDLSLTGRSGKSALEFQDQSLTFGDLDARSNRMAGVLQRRGLVRGDRLCVYLPNSIEFIDLFLACMKLGVIFVPVNILYRSREISHILADAEPKAAVGLTQGPPGVALWQADELAAQATGESGERPPATLDGDDPAAVVYTSGTTGASKGAILTHNNFAANAVNLLTCWRITESDRLLLPLPLFHVHGLGNGLHCWLIGGCHARLLHRFERDSAVNEFLSYKPTLFFGVPTMYVRLLETGAAQAAQIGARMRLFVSGSAPLAAQVLEEFRSLFSHTILERYGMTETLMIMSNPYEGERRAGTVGFPLPGVSVRLLDPEGRQVLDGATGEVHLKGPNLFAGYWRGEQATREALRDGWFRTGDLAVRSPDGYYTLEGRKSDLIISGGFNIYPREIEEFLTEQPEVAEAVVVGVPDRARGEIPVAYIVPRGAFAAPEMEARCRDNLSSYKVPKRFIVLRALPRTALGKVQKHLLPAPAE